MAPVVIPALAPTLRISNSRLLRLCTQSEPCATIWIGPQTSSRTRRLSLSPSRKASTNISPPVTISSWIKQTVILCYKLSDQEALTLQQVKAHDVRVFATSKGFQSGVSLEQLLSTCHWKSHAELLLGCVFCDISH